MSGAELSQKLTDYSACDREAIHLFTSIQNHGALLAFTKNDLRIQMASENSQEFLDIPLKETLGAKLDYIFEPHFIKTLEAHLETYPWQSQGRHLEVRPQVKDKVFDAYLFFSDGLFVVELEPNTDSSIKNEDEVENEQLVKDYMLQSKNCKNLAELSLLLCKTFRNITGLDRVMMYRFMAPTWHGEVIAEDRVTAAHSYMGHRFPSSDIPAQARKLYVRNQVRLISDVQSKDVNIVPNLNPLTRKALDMSDSRLRSVAKVHIEYLKNMEVGASFSVAVTDKDELWGLVTCHHLTPIHISQSRRTACEIIANAYSMQAPMMEQLLDQSVRLSFEMKLKKMLESLRLSSNPLDHFFRQHQSIAETFDATGVALVSESIVDFAGLTPTRSDLQKLARWLREKMDSMNQTVLAIDDLSEQSEQWTGIKDIASGVLAVLVPELQNSLLMIFRPEIVKTIVWGGDPRKQLDSRNFHGAINPRQSFGAWEEIVKERSTPWNKYEVDGILFLRDFVFEALVKKEQIIKELGSRRTTT